MVRERIVVALSGGVDSAVAASLLVDQGFDVVAVTLHLWDAAGERQVGRCCAPEDREDARRVADHLNIAHFVVDERESFRAQVVEPFLDSYLAGQTPSPCVHCNRTVKVAFLTELAERFGASRVATGHYARLEAGPDGTRLFRGRDEEKDQSYFLFGVPEGARRRLLCPLGALQKDEVRQVAMRRKLPNWDKKDSQELCFVPDGDVAGFIGRERGGLREGPLVDGETGAVLGTHPGAGAFTVGQRRGLGLGGGPPRYVLRVIPEDNTVIVGDASALYAPTAEVTDVTWLGPAPTEPFFAAVRIRHRHRPARARVVPTPGGFRAEFSAPERAITPGQAAVVYAGDEVLGGGFLSAVA